MTEQQNSALAEFNFLERLLERCPDYVPLLKIMGEMYTDREEIAKGLAVDLRLVELKPDDDESWYNLGCSYALANNPKSAFAALEKAIQLGYDSFEWLASDEDLFSLHSEPEWKLLLQSIKIS